MTDAATAKKPRYRKARATPQAIVENARARRARWRAKNPSKIKELSDAYQEKPENMQRRNALRLERRRTDANIQRRDNVRQRIAKATGIKLEDIPEILIEAKIAQLIVRHATRKPPSRRSNRGDEC